MAEHVSPAPVRLASGPLDVPERVWLALPAHHPVPELLEETRDAVAGLAETLAAVLPVGVLVAEDDAAARRLLPAAAERVPGPADLVLPGRAGPTFVHAGASVAAVAWRGPQTHAASAVAAASGLTVHRPLLAAPPSLWATDGEGTAVVSEAVLDGALNPGWDRAQAERELASAAGVEQVLWLPAAGAREAGPLPGPAALHAWVRFTAPGEAAVHWQAGRLHPDHAPGAAALHVLRGAVDAGGRALAVRTVAAIPPAAAPLQDERGPRSALDAVPLGDHVLRPALDSPEEDALAAAGAALLAPGAEELPFPLPPLLRLAGTLSDLVLVQPRPRAR